MRMAALGLCVVVFAWLGCANGAEASSTYPYYQSYPSRPSSPSYPQDQYPRKCPIPQSQTRPCAQCHEPRDPEPASPCCVQNLPEDPYFNLRPERVTATYVPVLDANGREICHFPYNDIVWVPRGCGPGEWCQISVRQSRSPATIMLLQ